jgi:hypothetical protein
MDSAPLPCSFLFSFLPFGSVPCPPLRTIGRVGFDPRSFSSWDGRSPVSHPTCDVPFPPRRPSEYWKRMIPARPLYQGVKELVWDPETSRERVGYVPLVCCRNTQEPSATRPNGEWGYSLFYSVLARVASTRHSDPHELISLERLLNGSVGGPGFWHACMFHLHLRHTLSVW